MSLRVWLPLDGDLRNQGISDLNTIIMPTCATIDNTGKIGKCYTSDGSVAGVSTNFNFQASEFSIAAWVRINTRVNAWRCPIKLIHSTEKDYIGFCCEHNTQASYIGFHFYKTIDNTNTPIFDTYPITDMPIGEWVHLTVTYNGKTAIYYKNGIKINSSTIAAAKQNAIANIDRIIMLGSDGGRSGAAVKSSLNDVRIYDHCLSAAEVREIAQGLVLHYKLDGGLFGNPNLLTNTEKLDATVTKPSGVIITPNGCQNFTTATYDNTSGTSYHELLYWNGKVTVNADEIYTASFYARSPVSAILTCYFYNNTSGVVQNKSAVASTGATSTSSDGNMSINLTPDWRRYWITWTFNSVTTSATKTLLFRLIAGRGEVSICGIKLEKGNTATPWCPADSEMNIDRTIVEDSSGYNHNGTLNTPTILNNNTPRYSEAIYFGAYNTPAITLNNATTLLPSLSNCTITWWGKYDTTKTLLLTGHTTTHYLAASNNNTYYHRNAGTVTFYKDGVAGTYECAADGWHFFAMTGVDISSWTALKFNSYSSSWPLNGYISDFRIYCTPLLDTDIKQLYNVGMKIDKLGSAHSFEFIEQQSNMIFPIELSRSNLEFTNGLSRYTQSNCQVTLTDQGYHIYRPPNLTTANDGNTMWGGLKLVNQKTDTIAAYDSNRDNNWGLQKGHTYFAAFHAKGKSSNSTSWGWANNMGWSGGGVNASPTIITNIGIPSDFQGEKDCIFIFTINDDIAKNCTSAYSSYVANTTYLSYRHLTFGWGYSSTGTLGTDLYLTDLRLYDITNYMAKITRQGQAKFYDFVEQLNKAQIRRKSEFLSSNFIER